MACGTSSATNLFSSLSTSRFWSYIWATPALDKARRLEGQMFKNKRRPHCSYYEDICGKFSRRGNSVSVATSGRSSVLVGTVQYCSEMCNRVQYCSRLRCNARYCSATVLYCTILYCGMTPSIGFCRWGSPRIMLARLEHEQKTHTHNPFLTYPIRHHFLINYDVLQY